MEKTWAYSQTATPLILTSVAMWATAPLCYQLKRCLGEASGPGQAVVGQAADQAAGQAPEDAVIAVAAVENHQTPASGPSQWVPDGPRTRIQGHLVPGDEWTRAGPATNARVACLHALVGVLTRHPAPAPGRRRPGGRLQLDAAGIVKPMTHLHQYCIAAVSGGLAICSLHHWC